MRRGPPLALLALLACCGHPPPASELVELAPADLVVTVEITGELAAVDSTDVMPPSIPDTWNFKIASLADEGVDVAAGDPLVAFDASELERTLDTLRNEADAATQKLGKRKVDAALARKDDELALREAEAALRKATLKTGAPTDQTAAIELRVIEADRQLAQMALERAQHHAAQVARSDEAELRTLTDEAAYATSRIAQIEQAVARMTVTAPRAGTVVYPTNWRGEKLKVGDGVWQMQAVLQVVSLGTMIGKGRIDEVDLARVADHQPVTLRLDALPDVQLRGRITRIAKNVEARSDTDPSKVAAVDLELIAQGAHPLRPGMRFRGEVETLRVPNVIAIPAEAVFVTADGPIAYRLDGDELTAVKLQLGRRTATAIEVVGGLTAGARVSRVDPTRSQR